MIAMQYNIALPGDYDMSIIKKRAQDNGYKTDGFLDLKMKAYLIAQKDKYSNYENQYAPFYLWEKAEGMNRFLLGGYFSNILSSFGWTQVRNWFVLHEYVVESTQPQYAIIHSKPITAFSDFTALCAGESASFENSVENPTTTAYVAAYNPSTWELCHYYMTTDLREIAKAADGSLIYDVHHISLQTKN